MLEKRIRDLLFDARANARKQGLQDGPPGNGIVTNHGCPPPKPRPSQRRRISLKFKDISLYLKRNAAVPCPDEPA